MGTFRETSPAAKSEEKRMFSQAKKQGDVIKNIFAYTLARYG